MFKIYLHITFLHYKLYKSFQFYYNVKTYQDSEYCKNSIKAFFIDF